MPPPLRPRSTRSSFEYDALAVVDDLEMALSPDSPLVHEHWESYPADDVVRDRNLASFSSIARGDADAAMESADIVVSSRFEADASHAVPIEPRGIVAQWEGEKVTIWTSTQVPFQARAGVCETLELPTNRVRVIVPHLGGGFGGKCGFHFEAHIAALARAANRPVKLVFSRRGGVPRAGQAPRGHVDRHRDRAQRRWIDRRSAGATTPRQWGIHRRRQLLRSTGRHAPGRAVQNPQRVHRVVTGVHQPSAFRVSPGPTAPQACWAVESHTNELAAAAGIDPVEFRRLNAVDSGDVGVVGQTYGEIGLQRCIETAVARHRRP